MSKPQQFKDWPLSIQPGFGPYRAVVERIVDGDTLYSFVDYGMNQYGYHAMRLKDVHAPELFTSDALEKQKGEAAKVALSEICPPGSRTLLHTEKDRASFGRYIAVLVLENGSVVNALMNEWLAEQGWS